MNMNFNIGKDTNKINNTVNEIQTESDDNNNSKKNDAKKRMIKFMAIIVGGIIGLLLIIFILSLFLKKDYTYDDIEQVLTTAAESYFKDHKSSLPKTEDEIVEIDSANLVAAEKMKDLTEYTKEGVICSATVQVEKAGSKYLYTPFLNCGEDYLTRELYQEIVSKDKVVTSGYGLYSQNGSYIYRGEDVNNYVKLDKALWRIVKVTADNNIVLIKETGTGETAPWDDRYNEQTGYSSGMNNYQTSRVKDNLTKLYNNKKDKDIIFLSSNDKTKLVSSNLCIGKRGSNEPGSDNSMECQQALNSQKIGLLTVSDYMNASIDPNCKTPDSLSCQNYNFLVEEFSWWLLTAIKGTSNEVYSVDNNGKIEKTNASSYAYVRPVITLNNKVLYKSGTGTKEDPYKIK